jgi:hypothetical protein
MPSIAQFNSNDLSNRGDGMSVLMGIEGHQRPHKPFSNGFLEKVNRKFSIR